MARRSQVVADTARILRAGVRPGRSRGYPRSAGPTDHGRFVVVAGVRNPRGEPTLVRVATWIEGTLWHPTLAGPEAADWLGSTLAILECLPDPPTPPTQSWLGSWLTQSPSEDDWQSLVQRGHREQATWAPTLARQIAALVQLGQLVGPANDSSTVTHTDLQPANVLVTDDGYALLDWDDVGAVSHPRSCPQRLAHRWNRDRRRRHPAHTDDLSRGRRDRRRAGAHRLR